MRKRNAEKDKIDVWLKINKQGPEECWFWIHDTLNVVPSFRGYSARKIVWYSIYGEWPKQELQTLCWKPNCFNPKHLVTKHDNQINTFNKNIANVEDCQIWKGTIIDKKGRKTCVFNSNGYKYVAHNFSWMLKFNEFPKSKLIKTCKSEFCVNASHYEERKTSLHTFWDKVQKGEKDDDCWKWNGVISDGSGFCTLAGKQKRANRISYILEYGHIPENMLVVNNCNTIGCVNPKHLKTTNASENSSKYMKDKLERYYNKSHKIKSHILPSLYNTSLANMKVDFCAMLKFRRSFTKLDNSCWQLNNSKSNKNYSKFYYKYNNVSYIGFAYLMYKKINIDNVRTYNVCDNIRCINPEHNLILEDAAKYRFNKSYIKNDITLCWNWNGQYNKEYGIFFAFGKKMPAHRASYLFYKGNIELGLVVRHICNNKKCVNPEHLELGTHSDNAQDVIKSKKDGTNILWDKKMRVIDGKGIIDLYKIGWTLNDLSLLFRYSQPVIQNCIDEFNKVSGVNDYGKGKTDLLTKEGVK